ncbi:hypothetical protein BGZ60DRAFT_539732 [Tricladium varicosporioides]|nr:hypothetical protein BGZ60DRAFT_539732 [Hymenoscyphus varicosporioides]
MLVEAHVKDLRASSEVETRTSDQLPTPIEYKCLCCGANEPLSKGYGKYDNYWRQK